MVGCKLGSEGLVLTEHGNEESRKAFLHYWEVFFSFAAIGWMLVYPHSCVETSSPVWCSLEVRAFGRWLGHKRGVFLDGISALIKDTPESPSAVWEDLAKRPLYMNQEAGCHQTFNLSASWSWPCQSLEFWEMNVYYLSHCSLWYICYSS